MATKFCEIFTLLLFYVVPVKSMVKISQNFVAFSEYMNFTTYEFYLASEYAFAFADNKKVAGYNDKNSNNWNNAKHH